MNPVQNIEKLSRCVTVYDVRWKKAVLIFSNSSDCYRYLTDRYIGTVSPYIKDKGRMHTNRFFRTLCFRDANIEQQKLLGDNDYIILDPWFAAPPPTENINKNGFENDKPLIKI